MIHQVTNINDTYTKYVSFEITMMIFGHIYLTRGRFYSVFPQIPVVVLSRILLHEIIQNYACSQYTYFARLYGYKLSEHSLIESTVVTIFPEFSGKCRSCVLLNEVAQNFLCKIHIIRNNNYTF